MKVTIVGAKGIVGKTLVEHFEHLGHKVWGIDRDNESSFDETVKKSDVVFIVTRPIREVPELIARALKLMRHGTLLVHGSSVQYPHSIQEQIDQISSNDVAVCHLHFHFRPQIPLRKTLRGQNVTLSIVGDSEGKWKKWLIDSLAPFSPFIHELEDEEHDSITSVSQLVHMILAFLLARIWGNMPSKILDTAMRIGGPPFRLMVRSILRTASGAGVAAEILECHPKTRAIIKDMQLQLKCLDNLIARGDVASIQREIEVPRTLVCNIADWDTDTARLIRLDADLQANKVEFFFSTEQNRIGLLADVLREFDQRGIDKTTAIAQTNPDGSCVFIVGVENESLAFIEAVEAIKSWG